MATAAPEKNLQEHMPAIRSKAQEQKGNHYDIEAIASELGRPLIEVSEIYTAEYGKLRERALVTDYLPILVARRIRAFYQDKTPTRV